MFFVRRVFVALVVSVTGSMLSARHIDPVNAASLALGGIDPYFQATLMNTNPALYDDADAWTGTLNCMNRYGLPELNTSAGAVSWISSGRKLEAGIFYFGTGLFSESQITLSYARPLFSRMKGGVRLNYHASKTAANDRFEQFASADLGLIVFLSKRLQLGASIVHLNYQGFVLARTDRRTQFYFSLAYVEAKHFSVAMQLALVDYRYRIWSAGAEYYLKDRIILRAGIRAGDILSYTFGISLVTGRTILTAGFEEHLVLGLSGALMINYALRKP